MRPLCRACHRLKTAGLLVPEARHHPGDPPGTLTWTTRTGRAYTALPHALLARPFGSPRLTATADDPPPF
jgi:hypothetical protein